MKAITTYIPKLIFILSIGLLIASCTERIDVELDDTYTRLVVDGQITSDDTSRHVITLTESTSYFYNQPPPPVSNADVRVIDDEGNSTPLMEDIPGKYYLPEGFKAEVGKVYTLDIELAKEIDGKTKYTATSTTPTIGDTVYIGLQHQPDWGKKGYYTFREQTGICSISIKMTPCSPIRSAKNRSSTTAFTMADLPMASALAILTNLKRVKS